MEFKASLDTLCKLLTAGAFLLIIWIAQKSVRELIAVRGDLIPTLVHSGVILFLLGTLVFTYLYSTYAYSVNNNKLIIHRPVANRIIKISDINEIRVIDSKELSGTIRTLGVGGLFGYYGKYYNSKIGSMTWYVTQQKNKILVRTGQGEKIIISPDDLSLIDKVQAQRLVK